MAHILNDRRTQDVRITQNVSFETLLLDSKTLKGLEKSGFIRPSPIQLHGIPLGKCGFDLLLEAKSGTGKTAVFSVIALEKLDLNKSLQTVILAPTREIAAQICDVLKQIGSQYEDLQVEVVMGGLPVHEDVEKFKKTVHVLVGSPGRVKHLIKDKHIETSAVRLLVLDEADKLMEKSFLNDINYIFNALPNQKQVILSSATYPQECKSIINNYVQNAQHICPDSTSILLGIAQKYTVVKCNTNIVRQTQHKSEELLKVLSKITFKQCIIFCNYQARVSELHKLLSKQKWPAEQLYGQQEQVERLDTLKTLQEYKCRILISTDLAARGIDASNVDLVINFEPPFEWQTYLHRIGRAGRFGSYGTAITILSEGKEFTKFQEIINSMKIDCVKLWTDENCDSTNSSEVPNKVSSVCQPLKVDTVFKKSYKSLWDALTKRNDDIGKITDSFEKLCESFYHHNTEVKAETFSDLIDSFEKFQNIPDAKFNYKHMKIYASPEIKEYLEDLNYIKNDESRFNTLVQSQKPGNSIVNNDINERDECSSKINNKKHESQRSSDLIFDIKIEEKSKKSWSNKYIYDDQDKEELIRAGLPAQFSSYKCNKHKQTLKPSQILKSQDVESNKYYIKNKKSFDKKNKSTSSKVYTDEHDDNLYYSYCEKLISRTNKKKLQTYNFVDAHKINSNNLKGLENAQWYSKLQFRVKHIEMMTYIEEMSRFKY